MVERSFFSNNGAQGFRFPSGTIPGMIGFDIRWVRSDHHVQWISVGPNNLSPLDSGDYLIGIRDNNSAGYGIEGTIKFEDLQYTAVHREVSGTGLRGAQRLRIPHLTSSEEFVLTGFYFIYESSDHNLLHFKLHQMAHNDHIYVNFGDNDGAELYNAYINYAVIPSSLLLHKSVQVRAAVSARSEATLPRNSGTALLQSFEFKFQNGDHHIQRIGMDLDDDQVTARFRDQNGDDPFYWMTEFVIIR